MVVLYTDRETDRELERETHTYTETDRQRQRQTERETDKQRERDVPVNISNTRVPPHFSQTLLSRPCGTSMVEGGNFAETMPLCQDFIKAFFLAIHREQ